MGFCLSLLLCVKEGWLWTHSHPSWVILSKNEFKKCVVVVRDLVHVSQSVHLLAGKVLRYVQWDGSVCSWLPTLVSMLSCIYGCSVTSYSGSCTEITGIPIIVIFTCRAFVAMNTPSCSALLEGCCVSCNYDVTCCEGQASWSSARGQSRFSSPH